MWSFDGKTGHHRRVRSADSNPFRGPPLQKRSSSSYLDRQFSDPEARRPLAKATLPTFGAYESASTRRRPSAGLVRWLRYVAIAFFGAVLLASRDVGARGVVGRLRSAGRRHLLEASLPDQEVPDPAATETSADGRQIAPERPDPAAAPETSPKADVEDLYEGFERIERPMSATQRKRREKARIAA